MKRLSTQRGLSLIALLIGLLISVLCILASLTLYKSLIRVAADSKMDSMHDGQLAAASLVIQMEVQSAGYGIASADADDVMEHIPTAGERQLLWRYIPNGGTTYECRGLHEYSETETISGVTATFRVLRVVKVASGCNGTAALNTFTWGTLVSVLGRWRVYDDGVAAQGLDKYVADNSTLFDFSFTTTACNGSYGAVTNAVNHLQLQVTAPGSARLQGATGVDVNKYDFCLPNTYPT